MKEKEYDILLREYEKLNRERADMYILSFDEHIAYLKRAFLRAGFLKHLELDFYNPAREPMAGWQGTVCG